MAVATSTATSEATKKRLELTEAQFDAKVELEQIKLDRDAGDATPPAVNLGDLPRPSRE